MPHGHFEGFLSDLDTIAAVARAGVISRQEVRLDPGETRPAAILHLDIVDFMALTKAVSPEELGIIIAKTFGIFELTVRSQGGYCDKTVGDASLYVFPGHPNHPPACEAALRASVSLLDRARLIAEALSHKVKPEEYSFAVRIGVSFGDVARVPDITAYAQRSTDSGGAYEQRFTVMGDTVNIAQRLQSIAEPGTIYTTNKVLDRSGDLTLSERKGNTELKGFGPVEVYQVHGFKPQQLQLRGGFRRLTPLIGREAVLTKARTKLEEWLETTYDASTFDITQTGNKLRGRNRLMVIRGAPAVGKSRLAFELVEALRAVKPLQSATAHYTMHGIPSDFAAELAQIAGVNAENLPERWDELCSHAAQVVSPAYAERQRGHLALLAHILDCKLVDTSGIRQADTASFMLNIRLALRACCELACFASSQPVVIIIEDLQWMGEEREIISDLLKQASLPVPLIIVATARLEYHPQPALLGEGALDITTLDKLSEGQGRDMMQALLPGLALPRHIETELHRRAEGLPYYYEEFARMLVRRKLVSESGGQYSLTREIDDLAIPEDIKMLILGRLDQLDPELRSLTGRASVLGRSFLKRLLVKLEERLGTNTPEKLETVLSDLEVQQVLKQEQGDRYFFEHVLTREAAYGSLLSSNRVLLHGLAADLLSELLIPGTQSEWEVLPELIRHLEQVKNHEAAHERCCDYLEMMAHTGRYENWQEYEDKARYNWNQVVRADATRMPVSASLYGVLGWQHYCQGRMGEARMCYEHALLTSRHGGDRGLQCKTLNFLGTLNRNQGRLDEGQRCYEEALGIARERGNRLTESTVLRNIGILQRMHGDSEAAQQCYEESLEIKREIGDRRGEGITLHNLGNLFRDQGQIDRARLCYEQSLAIKRETDDRRGEGITLSGMGVLQAAQGETGAARDAYQEALTISREIGDRRREAYALNCLGMLNQQEHRMEEARTCYEEALVIRREISDSDGVVASLSSLGTWYSEKGETGEAEHVQLEALELGRKLGLRSLEGEVLTELGGTYRKQGRLDEALDMLNAARNVLAATGDVVYLCIAQCYSAQLAAARGDESGAAEALAAARAIAEQTGSGPDSELARYLHQAEEATAQPQSAARPIRA
jgi:class 3 adenylate cyclase/tetratricopeptide (TPR) repeat protein